MRPITKVAIYGIVLPLFSFYVAAVLRRYGYVSMKVPYMALIVWPVTAVIVAVASS